MNSFKVHLILASVAIVQGNLSQTFEEQSGIGWWPVQPGATQLTQSKNNYDHSTDDPSLYVGGGTKPVPREDKSFKKPAQDVKSLFKPGSPYCRQVKNERSQNGSVTCYRCKDPKTGINFEQCSKNEKTRKLRLRRSASEQKEASAERDESLPDEYRFSEEYFLPQASKPVSYKDKNDACERVVKDSMVCMVCENARTHGKYKQCSYVRSPQDKAYEYSKSSSFVGDTDKPVRGRETHQAIKDESPESVEDSWDKRSPAHNYDDEKSQATESRCKKVHKDGQLCTVCKDPKTGGNTEKCFYEYQPSDKVYKFTRSKSFGFPYHSSRDKQHSGESVEVSETSPKKVTKNKKPSASYKDYSYGGASYESEEPYKSSESKADYEYSPPKSIFDSESEKIAEETKTAECKEVRKDDMICSICKDPKTGGNSERCTYSYQPDDKHFAYSQKKSFGNPKKDYGSDESDDEAESSDDNPTVTKTNEKGDKNRTGLSDEWESQPAQTKVDLGYFDTTKRKAEIDKFLEDFQTEDRTKCQKIMRDKMTCYQCVDERGFQKEECMYVTDPEPSNKKKVKREPVKEVLEPMASASSNHGTYKRYQKKQDAEKASPEEAEQQEPEAYDTVLDTRYIFDKVLGMALPAYMIQPSDAEMEFDKIYFSDY